MSNTNGLLTKAELHHLLGGWRMYLNPWINIQGRIQRATINDPVLQRKSLWSIIYHGTDYEYCSLFYFIFQITALIFFKDELIVKIIVLSIPINNIIVKLGIAGYNKLAEKPLLLEGHGCSTGNSELGMVFAADPFETEAVLIAGGMQVGDIAELGKFAEAMVTNRKNEREFVGRLLTVKTSVEVSPRTWELVKRATNIIFQQPELKSEMKSLPHIPSFGSVLDVMEHAGIPVRTRKTEV